MNRSLSPSLSKSAKSADQLQSVAATPARKPMQLEIVSRKLRVIAGLQPTIVHVEALRRRGRLEDLLFFGEHVERDDVRPPIVVEVSRVDTHGEPARVAGGAGYRLRESAVAVVDVEVVITLKIVGDIEIGTTIVIEITRDDAQPVSVDSVMQSGSIGDVGKMAAVVPKQLITDSLPLSRIPHPTSRRSPPAHRLPLLMRRVIEQVHIQIAVAIVIEEQRLGGVAGVVDTHLLRAIGQCAIPII